jgi:PEGA domain
MRSLILVASAMALSACATITKGTDDSVTISSVPPGAKVGIKDVTGKLAEVTCTTPCNLELNRKWTYNVTFAKEGHKDLTAMLEPKLSGDGTAGMAGNILLGGIIGAGVDASTGAMNDLRPNPMVALLAPTESAEESTLQLEATAREEAKVAKAAKKK